MSNILVNQLTGNTTDTTIEVFAGHAADSTTRTNLEQGLAKAWIDFNGSGTIAARDSFNNASLTDNGTGHYTITPTNTFANASYCGSGTQENNFGTVSVPKQTTSLATGSTTIHVVNSTNANDSPYIHLVIHGDLA